MLIMAELNYQSSGDRRYERSPTLRKLFGPSQEEIWHLLAQQIGAKFSTGGWWKGGARVDAQVGQWIVTLDSYAVSTGKSTVVYTRMRAPYVNKDGFRFSISRAGFFSSLAAKLGFQDVETGIEEFDKAFVVKSDQESRVKLLLADPELRARLLVQRDIQLSVVDDEGWFGAKFPEGVDELRFITVGIIKDMDRLQQLFELFAVMLNRLCHIGSAYEDDPKVRL